MTNNRKKIRKIGRVVDAPRGVSHSFLHKYAAMLIPPLLAAAITACFVGNFSSGIVPYPLLLLITLFLELIQFKIFDCCQKKKLYVILFIVFVAVLSYLSGFVETILYATLPNMGFQIENTKIFFIDWFFSTTASKQFCPDNYLRLLLVGLHFFGFAVYYYTRCYFRLSVLFVLTLFPPIIYAKDYETLPTGQIVLLLLLFFAAVIHSRQTIEANDRTRVAFDRSYAISVSLFICIGLLVAIVLPKPDINDRRAEFDSFTSGSFSSRYARVIDDFTNFSNGNNTDAMSSNKLVYQVAASEAMNLKAQTFYYYDELEDRWMPDDRDTLTAENSLFSGLWQKKFGKCDPRELLCEIIYACNKHPELVEEYGLILPSDSTDIPDNRRNLSYWVSATMLDFFPFYVLSPDGVYSADLRSGPFNDGRMKIGATFSRNLYSYYDSNDNSYRIMSYNRASDVIEENYYSSTALLDNNACKRLLNSLTFDSFKELLVDVLVLEPTLPTAMAYYVNIHGSVVVVDEVFSDRIVTLADQITAGCHSDYEKANAIEEYFVNAGFVYDLDYVCPEGENIEDFLFNSKRGSCYHYATSMTLLCQAVGLPARYCEGFQMGEPEKALDDTNKLYNIYEANSHSFPEVYISGYGWMGFEPTVPGDDNGLGTLNFSLAFLKLLIVIGFVIIVSFKLILPLVRKINVSRLISTGRYGLGTKRMLRRIYAVEKIPPSMTPRETAARVLQRIGADIYPIVSAFERSSYGGQTLSRTDMSKTIAAYNAFNHAVTAKRNEAALNRFRRFFTRKKSVQNNT